MLHNEVYCNMHLWRSKGMLLELLFEVEELIHVIMEQVEPHIRKLQSLLVGACGWTAAV